MQQDYASFEYAASTTEWADASTGQRFGNYLIDVATFYLGCLLIGILLGIGLELAGNSAWIENLDGPASRLVGMLLMSMYYFVLEVATGRTIGKLFTRTRVVMADGSELTTKAVAVRSLCRLIPFDAFSFLGGRTGWHDQLSKTRVVQIPR
ncbi:MAG TPA: RDD family protein [Hymenobacter sp.]|jgi:uncharacterized RDD family membrane protein YckC